MNSFSSTGPCIESEKNQSREGKYEKIITCLLFFTIFLVFVTPTADNDMPWHLKTGEYILTNLHLPTVDPFSYANTEVSKLGQFILTQYWLAQIMFWIVFSLFGVIGIGILISSIFSLTAFVLYSMIRRKNSLLALFVTSCYLVYFIYGYHTLRPQIFTFLFSTLTIFFIEKYKETYHRFYLVLVPIMFLLWANMHGGFIFGIVILSAYLLSDFISLIFPSFSNNHIDIDTFRKMLFVTVLSLGLCYFNPNGYDAFGYAVRSHSTEIFSNIMEYQSPLQLNSLSTNNLLKFWLTIPLSLVVILLGLLRRKIWAPLIIFLTMVMSFTAIRYYPLLVIVTTAGICQISSKFNFSISQKRSKIFQSILITVLITFSGYFISKVGSNPYDLSDSQYNPDRAIKFLKDNRIQGNIYGSYNKSGHLILELFPESKVFWSSNFISTQRFNDGQIIGGKEVQKNGMRALYNLFPKGVGVKVLGSLSLEDEENYQRWLKLINESETEIIVHEALNIFSGEPSFLIFLLLEREDWKLVYSDGEVMIFLKDIPKFQENIRSLLKPKSSIFDQLIVEGIHGWAIGNANFPAIAALGNLLKGDSGKYTDELIQDALNTDPKNKYALVNKLILNKMNNSKEKLPEQSSQ